MSRSSVIIKAVSLGHRHARIISREQFSFRPSNELQSVSMKKETCAKGLTQLHVDNLVMSAIVYSPSWSVELFNMPVLHDEIDVCPLFDVSESI